MKISALALLLLFLVLFTHHYQWAAMGQKRCLASKYVQDTNGIVTTLLTRDLVFTPFVSEYDFDVTKFSCINIRYRKRPGVYVPDCCKGLEGLNLTCLCNPDSELSLPKYFLTRAQQLCNIPIPQTGHCRGYCGWNAAHLQAMVETCTPKGDKVVDGCCKKLRALDFKCLCSSVARVAIPRTLLTAATLCKIDVPQTGQCPPNATLPILCETITQNDLDELEPKCSQSPSGSSTSPADDDCCKGLSGIDLPCLCSRGNSSSGSGLVITPNILSGATRCNITFPQAGLCQQGCGGLTENYLQRNIKEAVSRCLPFQYDCCTKLQALNFTCVCSPAASNVHVKLPSLLSAAEICKNISVPKIGHCHLPEEKCKVVKADDILLLQDVCDHTAPWREDIREMYKEYCCRGAATLLNSTSSSCPCSNSSRVHPRGIKTFVQRNCKPVRRIPNMFKKCSAGTGSTTVTVKALPAVEATVATPLVKPVQEAAAGLNIAGRDINIRL